MSRYGDVLDLRDLGKELEELKEEKENDPEHFYNQERLDDLLKLAEQLGADDLEAYGNNQEPTMIAETYFEEYAQELAEDIGAINRNATWPNNCIDWKEAAEQLQQDYTSVEFDGTTYYIRSC